MTHLVGAVEVLVHRFDLSNNLLLTVRSKKKKKIPWVSLFFSIILGYACSNLKLQFHHLFVSVGVHGIGSMLMRLSLGVSELGLIGKGVLF